MCNQLDKVKHFEEKDNAEGFDPSEILKMDNMDDNLDADQVEKVKKSISEKVEDMLNEEFEVTPSL